MMGRRDSGAETCLTVPVCWVLHADELVIVSAFLSVYM